MNIAFAMSKRVKQQVGKALLVSLTMVSSALAEGGKLPASAQERLIEAECQLLMDAPHARRALQMAKVMIQSQGMRLVVDGCPYVHTSAGHMQQVMDVHVLVVDSETASNFVRGPLADGEEVDMGAAHIPPPAAFSAALQDTSGGATEDVSPDVEFNRSWLAGVMRGRGWVPVPGHWWAFVPAAVN